LAGEAARRYRLGSLHAAQCMQGFHTNLHSSTALPYMLAHHTHRERAIRASGALARPQLISPACFSSAHRAVGIGNSTILTLSSTSATDRAPGITEAIAGCARMNCNAAAFKGTWYRAQTALIRWALSIISSEAAR